MTPHTHTHTPRRAFTLIELLVVIAIIGILSAVVLVSLNTARAKARDAQRQQDIRSVNNALQAYFADYGSYPITGGASLAAVRMDPGCQIGVHGGLDAGDQITEEWIPGLVAGGYIAQLPRDPRGGQRGNDVPGTGYVCYTYASDGNVYVLSAWGTVESGQISTTHGMYSRAGFRESGWPPNYMCNHPNIGSPSNDYYRRSFTITNANCTW